MLLLLLDHLSNNPYIYQRTKNGQKMKIGYARVSTGDQSLALQHDALQNAQCEQIYTDVTRGKDRDRPQLNQCLKVLRAADILIVWRLDRLGRSLSHLIKIPQDLENRAIHFKILKENIDTTTPAGKLMFHVVDALAEYERELIRERTLAGLKAARARGRGGGRPQALTPAQITEIKTLKQNPAIPIKTITERYKISRATLYNYIK